MHALSEEHGGRGVSRGMARFVVLNTASLQLLPTTLGALRAAAGSAHPFDILPAIWITSALSLAAALTVLFVWSVSMGDWLRFSCRFFLACSCWRQYAGTCRCLSSFRRGQRKDYMLACHCSRCSQGFCLPSPCCRHPVALELAASWVQPFASLVGLPAETVPLALLKPVQAAAPPLCWRSCSRAKGRTAFPAV